METLFLDDLLQEHKSYLDFLALKDEECLSKFEEFCTELQRHHEKEEKILFKIIERENILDSGGPNCISYYFPRTMDNFLWEDGYHALKKRISVSNLQESHEKSGGGVIGFGGNGMLMIPREDHQLGHAILGMIRQEKCIEVKADLWGRFRTFLREHIEREDNCLFLLCDSRLSFNAKREYLDLVKDLQASTW